MSVQTYVGARYVPKFSDLNGGDWDNQYSYEALEIVKNGNDYFVKRFNETKTITSSFPEMFVMFKFEAMRSL